MAPECRHILRNGQKCRAAATHNQPFCRHHGPKPAHAGPPPIAKRDIYSRLARWRAVGRELPWIEPAEIPFAVYQILDALTSRNPSDRLSDPVAGRYLRTLLTRLGRVPFAQPNFAVNAPPPPPAPGPRSVPAPAPSHPPFDNSTLPPGLRSALEAVYQNTNEESVDALMDAIARFDPAAPRPQSTRSSHP